jgi:hypothetical protein
MLQYKRHSVADYFDGLCLVTANGRNTNAAAEAAALLFAWVKAVFVRR